MKKRASCSRKRWNTPIHRHKPKVAHSRSADKLSRYLLRAVGIIIAPPGVGFDFDLDSFALFDIGHLTTPSSLTPYVEAIREA